MPPISRTPASPPAQQGPNTVTAQTTTIRPPSIQLQHPVLRLRGAMRSPGERSERRIHWADDVIDNEGLGRKSSKGFTCIAHMKQDLTMKQYAAFITHPKTSLDDSSDDSSSGCSSSDSDTDTDDGSARPVGGKRSADARRHKNSHEHDSSGDYHHGAAKMRKLRRSRSPNAYEKMTKSKGSGAK